MRVTSELALDSKFNPQLDWSGVAAVRQPDGFAIIFGLFEMPGKQPKRFRHVGPRDRLAEAIVGTGTEAVMALVLTRNIDRGLECPRIGASRLSKQMHRRAFLYEGAVDRNVL